MVETAGELSNLSFIIVSGGRSVQFGSKGRPLSLRVHDLIF